MNEKWLAVKIFETMSARNRGRENAEPRRCIELRLGLTIAGMGEGDWDRKVRRAYETLPICACNDGIFVPIRAEEVAEYRKYLGPKIPPDKVELKIRRILVTWPQLVPRPKQEQLSLAIGQGKAEARP